MWQDVIKTRTKNYYSFLEHVAYPHQVDLKKQYWYLLCGTNEPPFNKQKHWGSRLNIAPMTSESLTDSIMHSWRHPSFLADPTILYLLYTPMLKRPQA